MFKERGMRMKRSIEKEKFIKYDAICKRAEKMGILKSERLSVLMDIESADLKFGLRLDEWLEADDFNFAHDFCGIQNNINGSEFPSKDFGYFVPRFSLR